MAISDARVYKPLFELVYLGGMAYIWCGQVVTQLSVFGERLCVTVLNNPR